MNKIELIGLPSLRKKNKISQETLAEMCNVSVRTIQRAEKDNACSEDLFSSLCAIFDIKIDEEKECFNNELKNKFSPFVIKYAETLKSKKDMLLIFFGASLIMSIAFLVNILSKEFSPLLLLFFIGSIFFLVSSVFLLIKSDEACSFLQHSHEIKYFNKLKNHYKSAKIIHDDTLYLGASMAHCMTLISSDAKQFCSSSINDIPNYSNFVKYDHLTPLITAFQVFKTKDNKYFIMQINTKFSDISIANMYHIDSEKLKELFCKHKEAYEILFGKLKYQ